MQTDYSPILVVRTGDDCADTCKCEEGCEDHGQCVDGICICQPNFSGPICNSGNYCIKGYDN